MNIEDSEIDELSIANSYIKNSFILHAVSVGGICINHNEIEVLSYRLPHASTYFLMKDTKISRLDFSNLHLHENSLEFYNVIIKNIDRKSARIIKSEAIRANDVVLAIEYEVREMEEYRKEKKHWRSAGTYLLLWLNKWSNYYGKCWWQGVIFTVVCWMFFYGLFVVLRDIIENQPMLSAIEYIKESVNYLWLLNGLSGLLEDTGNTCWWLVIILVVIFVLGKILIGYGIYQTVAVFRRLSK